MGKLTVELKQQKLDNIGDKIKFHDDIIITSLGDIIYNLWFNNTNTKTIRYHKGRKKFVSQITGTFRSIEDLYIISKNYIPNIKYSDILKAIDSIDAINKYIPNRPRLNSQYCISVRRRVFWSRSNDFNKEDISKELDKLNILC